MYQPIPTVICTLLAFNNYIGSSIASNLLRRGNIQEDNNEDCIPASYFLNTGSGSTLGSFTIINGPPELNVQEIPYTSDVPIEGDLKGYEEILFHTHNYPWDNSMTYTLGGLKEFQLYDITLGFADNEFMCGEGRYHRVFNVNVNGESFIQDLNLEQVVGCNTAHVVTGQFYPKNNTFIINFHNSYTKSLKPIISFISIKPILQESQTRNMNECNNNNDNDNNNNNNN